MSADRYRKENFIMYGVTIAELIEKMDFKKPDTGAGFRKDRRFPTRMSIVRRFSSPDFTRILTTSACR